MMVRETYHRLGPRFYIRKLLGVVEITASKFDPVDRMCLNRSKMLLRRRMAQEESIDDILDTIGLWDELGAYNGHGQYRFLRAIQDRESIQAVTNALIDQDPDIVVEIGSHLGGSLYVWCRCFQPRLVVSIDLDFHDREPFLKSFLPDSTMHFVTGDSTIDTTRNRVESALDGSTIDFLYIDGSHAYENVQADFKQYSPLMADDGVIGFDDLNHEGVARLWNELKQDYRTIECGGNGLLYL